MGAAGTGKNHSGPKKKKKNSSSAHQNLIDMILLTFIFLF